MNIYQISLIIVIIVQSSIGWTPWITQVRKRTQVDEELHPHLVELRIPSFLLTSAINQSFEREASVDEIILETHTTGKARCVGNVSSELLDSRGTAIVRITIRGKLNSETASKCGPAIINAESETEYTAIKHLEVFEGRLEHSPTELQSTTSLIIGSVETTLPRWTGRIVKQVASKKAHSSHQEAEQITAELTRSELLSNIEKEFDTQIATLNGQIERQTAVLHHISGGMFCIEINSKKDAVEVALRRKKRSE